MGTEFESGRSGRVEGGPNRRVEDWGSGFGGEFGEVNGGGGIVFMEGGGVVLELAVEKLEHVVEALGLRGGGDGVVLVAVVVVVIIIGGGKVTVEEFGGVVLNGCREWGLRWDVVV